MKKNSVVWETLIYSVGSMAVSVLGFAISLLHSKMFPETEYGMYSLAFSLYSVISIVCGNWLVLSLLRNEASYKIENRIKELYATVMGTHIVTSGMIFVLGNAAVWVLKLSGIYRQLLMVLSMYYFFDFLLQIIYTILRTNGMAKAYSASNILRNVLKMALLLGLYYVFDFHSVTAIVVGLLIATVIQCGVYGYKIQIWKCLSWKDFQRSTLKQLFLFGFPLVGVTIASEILTLADRFVIRVFYSDAEVGVYSYAYSLAFTLFILFTQIIMLGGYPRIVKVWERKRESIRSVIGSYLTMYCYLVVPACCGVAAVAQELFSVLIGVRYQGGWRVFVIVCIATAVLGLSEFTNKAWELTKKTRDLLLYYVLTAGVNVVLNFIFVPLYGYEVAAVTTLVSYVFYFVVSLIVTRKILPLEPEWKHILITSGSAMAMWSIIKMSYRWMPESILGLFGRIVIGVSVYGAMMLLFGEGKHLRTVTNAMK